jgi:glycosyltransferase involved in cell wall biosynthesis
MNQKRAPQNGSILFVGKRFYTNKDTWEELFGRMYHLPAAWSRAGKDVCLWLVDYHTRETLEKIVERLDMVSTPARGLSALRVFQGAVRRRPQTVVASGDCYIALLGWFIARLSGAQFVLDIYDKYDEFAGYVKPLGIDLFGFVRNRADFRLYASRALAEQYACEHPATGFHIAPNGVDPALFRPLSQEECRRKLGLPADRRLIGYFGSMEPDRGVQDLVQAVAWLREQGERIELLLCGKRHADTSIDEPWIVYRGTVAHADIPEYMNACDLLALPYRSSQFMDMGSSCKIAEYLMCKRPLVSTRTPNFIANFPQQAEELRSVLADPGNIASLAKAIQVQLRDCRIATMPVGMDWPSIAGAALLEIRSVESHAIV